MREKTYYNRLDSLKSVAAVMVVLIHTSTFLPYTDNANWWNYYWYRGALDLAVPIFFLASGFLLGGKKAASILRSAGKIFALYLAASLFYIALGLLFVGLDCMILDESPNQELSAFFGHWSVLEFVQGVLAQGHLWFLMSLCLSMLVIAGLTALRTSPAVTLGLATLAYGTQLTVIHEIGGFETNGGPLKGLFYTALGMALWKYASAARTWHLLAGLLGTAAYTALMLTTPQEVLSQLVLAVSVAFLGTWSTAPNRPRTKLASLATYSLTVYILHMALINIINRTIRYSGFDIDVARSLPGYPFIICAVVVIACIALHKPFNRYIFQPIQGVVFALFGVIGKAVARATA